MKQLIFPSLMVLLAACNSNNNKTTSAPNASSKSDNVSAATQTSTTSTQAATATTPKSEPVAKTSANRDLKFYYKTYANVDSESPSIGVGPRKILTEDAAAGMVTYIRIDENIKDTLRVWNKNGYDVIDYPGGWLICVNGEYLSTDDPNVYVQKIADKRSARGAECDYYFGGYNVIAGDRVEVLMKCSDNQSFREVVGYATVKNGKVVITEQ